MNKVPGKLVTRGFGRVSNRRGVLAQGFGGVLSQVAEAIAEAGRRIVTGGKSAAEKIKRQIDDVVVRVTLLSVNDRFVDKIGIEHGEIDRANVKPRISFTLLSKRVVELIRLSIKRIK